MEKDDVLENNNTIKINIFDNVLFLQPVAADHSAAFSYPLGIFDEKTPPNLQKSLTIPKLDSIII